jgi:hypothetical protein
MLFYQSPKVYSLCSGRRVSLLSGPWTLSQCMCVKKECPKPKPAQPSREQAVETLQSWSKFVTGGSIVTRDNSGCVPTESGVRQSKNIVLIHYTCALSPDEVKRHSILFFFLCACSCTVWDIPALSCTFSFRKKNHYGVLLCVLILCPCLIDSLSVMVHLIFLSLFAK